ncbi:DDE superfamily endonuclease [Popillia japonica]|uniref:DDE superfamily endonuclease n=1 Tax=Popillia japonica TaxID=7064 RepID=A0AAW1ITK4_POPJA
MSSHDGKFNVLFLPRSVTSVLHPSDVAMSSHDGKFNVLFLPRSVTSVLQPMDQGVIETFKRFNRKQLLQMLLLDMENGEESVLSSYKKLNLKDAVYMAADAWASVKDTTLEKAWNKLCPNPGDSSENGDTEPDDPQDPQENDDPDEIRDIIKEAPGFEGCDKANIDDWLNCDVDDPGYQILSDEEIVQQIKDNNQKVGEEEEDGEDTEVEDDVPTYDEAFTCLEKAMKWLQRQAFVLKKTKRFSCKKTC